MAADTATALVEAARVRLLADGYAAFSTRRVADEARVPLSQIHYHFGGRQGLVLALLERENDRLVARQAAMYGTHAPLSARYAQACDYLADDLASGYVRVLHEMVAAGWSDPAVAGKVVEMLQDWFDLLARVVGEAEEELGRLGPMNSVDVANLVGLAFLGAESVLLLDHERWTEPVMSALRAVGSLIRLAEVSRGR